MDTSAVGFLNIYLSCLALAHAFALMFAQTLY
jgi:hypothetical protein